MNHLKVTTHQQYLWNGVQLSGDFGYQFNHREEWSAFHTHYDTQVMPAKDPDRELVFKLHTFSSSLKLRLSSSSSWEHMAGWNMQIQKNAVYGILKYITVVVAIIFIVMIIAGYKKKKAMMRKLDLVMIVIMSLLGIFYLGITVLKSIEVLPAYYFLMPLVGAAVLMQIIRNGIAVGTKKNEK